MPSAAQIRANRANAQRSTGPRYEAGKDSTRWNALKHGLAAEKLVIRGEDPANLEALRAQLRADYAPATEVESMLVEEIAQCWWRLQRARAEESRAITVSMTLRPYADHNVGPVMRYMTSVERAWHRALTQLRLTQSDRLKRGLAVAETATETTPAPQPEEETRVMAVGSVPQNQPQAPVPPVSRPAGPAPVDKDFLHAKAALHFAAIKEKVRKEMEAEETNSSTR